LNGVRSRREVLDKSSPVPLYYQLFLRVQADIRAGLVRPGDLLGTEREIQERYDVSRATVRKALDELARNGHLVRITGRGTFVTDPRPPLHTPHLLSFTEEMERQGIVPGTDVLEFSRVPCPPQPQEALGCRENAQVLYLRRLRTGDGRPILLVDHFLAPAVRLRRSDLGQSLYETLEQTLGIRLQEAYHTLRAGRAEQEEAGLLGIETGEPVLRFERTTMTAERKPVVFEQGSARADAYTYSVHLFRR
jgi:GntR family transcriptional regulator